MYQKLVQKPIFVDGGIYGHMRVKFWGATTMIQAIAQIEHLIRDEVTEIESVELFNADPRKDILTKDNKVFRVLGTNLSADGVSFWLFLEKDFWVELKVLADQMFPDDES